MIHGLRCLISHPTIHSDLDLLRWYTNITLLLPFLLCHLNVKQSNGWCCCFCSEDSLFLQHPTCSAVYQPTLCPFLALLSLLSDASMDRKNLISFRMGLLSFVVSSSNAPSPETVGTRIGELLDIQITTVHIVQTHCGAHWATTGSRSVPCTWTLWSLGGNWLAVAGVKPVIL